MFYPIGTRKLNDYEKESNRVHSERLSDSFDSNIPTQTEMLETLNLNSGYLLSILRLIDEWVIIRVNGIGRVGKENPDYYSAQVEILDTIMALISCKIKTEERDELRKRIDDVTATINQIFVQTENGMYLNGFKSTEIKRSIATIFEDILSNMEKRGMLTYKPENPKFAMGKFSD